MTSPIDEREVIRILHPRSEMGRESALGLEQSELPSIFEDSAYLRFAKGIEIRHTTPEIRLTEVDQTDPAGRYRRIVTGDILTEQRAATAGWATSNNWLTVDTTNISLRGSIFAANTATFGLGLYYGTSAANYGGHIILYGHGHSTVPGGIVFATSTANGQLESEALRLTGATAAPQAVFPQGSASGTSPSITFKDDQDTGFSNDGLNTLFMTAGATSVLEAIPTRLKTRVVLNIFTSTTVPTTTTLEASQIRFVVDAGDQLIAYWNDAGTVRTYTIGTLL